MKAIHTIFFWLESFERDGHIKNAMTRLLGIDDLAVAIAWVNSLPAAEQMMLKGRLTKLSLATEQYCQQLISQMDAMRLQIVANRENTNAHLAYLQTVSMNRPKSCH